MLLVIQVWGCLFRALAFSVVNKLLSSAVEFLVCLHVQLVCFLAQFSVCPVRESYIVLLARERAIFIKIFFYNTVAFSEHAGSWLHDCVLGGRGGGGGGGGDD